MQNYSLKKSYLGIGFYSGYTFQHYKEPFSKSTVLINGYSLKADIALNQTISDKNNLQANAQFKYSISGYGMSNYSFHDFQLLQTGSAELHIEYNREIADKLYLGAGISHFYNLVNFQNHHEYYSDTNGDFYQDTIFFTTPQSINNNTHIIGLGFSLNIQNIRVNPFYNINIKNKSRSGPGIELFWFDIGNSFVTLGTRLSLVKKNINWLAKIVFGYTYSPLNFEFSAQRTFFDKNISAQTDISCGLIWKIPTGHYY